MSETAELEQATPVEERLTIVHIAAQDEDGEPNMIALCGKRLSFLFTPSPGQRAECEVCNLLAEAIDWEEE